MASIIVSMYLTLLLLVAGFMVISQFSGVSADCSVCIGDCLETCPSGGSECCPSCCP